MASKVTVVSTCNHISDHAIQNQRTRTSDFRYHASFLYSTTQLEANRVGGRFLLTRPVDKGLEESDTMQNSTNNHTDHHGTHPVMGK